MEILASYWQFFLVSFPPNILLILKGGYSSAVYPPMPTTSYDTSKGGYGWDGKQAGGSGYSQGGNRGRGRGQSGDRGRGGGFRGDRGTGV